MMIVVPDDGQSKAEEHAQEVRAEASSAPSDAPPAYETEANPIPPSLKPTNFICINRSNNSIKEVYAIDTAMPIPESFLPQLQPGVTERKNVSLTSSNGSIDATIHLIPNRPKASLEARSTNGAIEIRVQRGPPSSAFSLNVSARNGSIRVYVPRDYLGPLTLLTGNGSLRLSDEVAARSTSFSEVKQQKKMFIGDLGRWSDKDWDGDEIVLDSRNGGIKVSYVDEVQQCGRSFWSHFF